MAIARRRRQDDDDDDDEDDYFPPPDANGGYASHAPQGKKGCCGRCLSHKVTRGILKFAFSNAGLCIIVILYTVGGGFLMQACELGNEKDIINATRFAAQQIEADRMQLAEDLKGYIWQRRHSNRSDIVMEIRKKIDEYHALLTATINNEDLSYDGTVTSEEHEKYGWGIASALLFTATILTTIGYGHVFPITEVGQLVMLLYSLFAIPLMSMFLINIGSAIANVVRYIYQNGCCRVCRRKRRERWAQIKADELDEVEDVHNEPHAPPARPKSAWSVDQDGNPVDPIQLEQQQLAEKKKKEKKEEEEPRDVPASLSALIVISYLLMGTLVFSWTEEDWTLTNSVYFTFVTLSTVGFGDFVPGLHDVDTFGGKMRLAFTACYIIVGLAVLAMGVDLATAAVAQRFTKVVKVVEAKAIKGKKKDDMLDEEGPMGNPAIGSPNDIHTDIHLNDHFDDITPPAVIYR